MSSRSAERSGIDRGEPTAGGFDIAAVRWSDGLWMWLRVYDQLCSLLLFVLNSSSLVLSLAKGYDDGRWRGR